ncbi:MAG: cytochrome c [Euryarchaeota archaeon]|nr:cytochrome c [Euryarchaeota archaeon]
MASASPATRWVLLLSVLLLWGGWALGATPEAPPAAPAAGGDSMAPPAKAPNPERGKALFEQKCVSCHGKTGLGDGVSGVAPPPANFHDLGRFAARSDADLFKTITLGRSGTIMPAFAELNDQQKWDIISYLRSEFMYEPVAAAGGGEKGPRPQEMGFHLRAYWLGLLGLGATFLLMLIAYAVVRFSKKR